MRINTQTLALDDLEIEISDSLVVDTSPMLKSVLATIEKEIKETYTYFYDNGDIAICVLGHIICFSIKELVEQELTEEPNETEIWESLKKSFEESLELINSHLEEN